MPVPPSKVTGEPASLREWGTIRIVSGAGVRAMEWGRSVGELLPIIRIEAAPICPNNNRKQFAKH